MSAGLIKAGDDIEAAFKQIETIVIDMETGMKVDVDPKTFSQIKASKDPEQNVKIPAAADVAGLSTRAKLAKVFLTRDGSGAVDTIILNVWGKGLWSTMYGFLALGSDTNTIKGFAYYAQGETPGLGGEIEKEKFSNSVRISKS